MVSDQGQSGGIHHNEGFLSSQVVYRCDQARITAAFVLMVDLQCPKQMLMHMDSVKARICIHRITADTSAHHDVTGQQ